MFSQRRSSPRRLLAIAAATLVVGAGAAATAPADPLRPKDTFQFALTCTGLGDVLATNLAMSQNEAVEVVGTNTVILLGLDGEFGEYAAPGIITQARAAGTTCTLTAAGPPGALTPEPPVTFPVVIVNG